MERSFIARAAGAALVAALFFIGGLVVGQGVRAESIISQIPLLGDGLTATPDTSADLSTFWKAWNALQTNFVQTHASSTLPDNKKKLFGAIQGLAASYGDPYTTFFPPQEAKEFQENISGEFSGVGMEIDVKEGILTVVTPLKGSPAEKAGVKSGDLVIAINGASTEGLSTEQGVAKIRGEKGTSVTLTLYRDKKSFDVTIVRDTIVVPETDESFDEKTGIYSISLYQFTASSDRLFQEAFDRFKQSGSRKLILDLRGNPGGYLEAAVDMASHFLPKGTVVVTEDHQGKMDNEVHTSEGYNDMPAGTKMVILINQGSASASEILAGALQDHKIASLVGMRSFGKGSVQQLIDIDGGALKVTIARWLTPVGRSISDGGLKPDIQVDRTQADFDAKKDPQMDRAIQFLTTGK